MRRTLTGYTSPSVASLLSFLSSQNNESIHNNYINKLKSNSESIHNNYRNRLSNSPMKYTKMDFLD